MEHWMQRRGLNFETMKQMFQMRRKTEKAAAYFLSRTPLD